MLTTWRERLPNTWDDIIVWNDLLSWRQHIFNAINESFASYLDRMTGSSVAFLGCHETAWTINRFAHVARAHGLLDVCLNSLAKIYTLPNIEIQDAFLKLREQAKWCAWERPPRTAHPLCSPGRHCASI